MRSAGRPRKLPPAVFSLYFLLPAAALPGRTADCVLSVFPAACRCPARAHRRLPYFSSRICSERFAQQLPLPFAAG